MANFLVGLFGEEEGGDGGGDVDWQWMDGSDTEYLAWAEDPLLFHTDLTATAREDGLYQRPREWQAGFVCEVAAAGRVKPTLSKHP